MARAICSSCLVYAAQADEHGGSLLQLARGFRALRLNWCCVENQRDLQRERYPGYSLNGLCAASMPGRSPWVEDNNDRIALRCDFG
ncbi:hypothetical protein Trco_005271 [Trichoderma cornu-damae]|uniref:Uncharacterized protein n=1 Tax=Trichoderma cornu-damae TaxID=654480 RepID=A0A9P8QNX5_9HYPO|nr:hypothetical protein Trco_005271 [Trichoderma cornu-damae]